MVNFTGRGSAFAVLVQNPADANAYDDKDVWGANNTYGVAQSTTRATIENVYVNFTGDRAYGILYRTHLGVGSIIKNVLIDAPKLVQASHGATSEAQSAVIGGSSWYNNGTGGNNIAPTNVYVYSTVAHTGTTWGNNIVWSSVSLADLYAKALTIPRSKVEQGSHKTIGETFNTLPYWTIVDTNGDGVKGAKDAVYWARLAPEA
jgi:hypothetical protein